MCMFSESSEKFSFQSWDFLIEERENITDWSAVVCCNVGLLLWVAY